MSSNTPLTSKMEDSLNAESAPVVAQEKDKEKEDIVAKYKRLLAMARISLESNQASLLEKDSQIKKLKKLLDEEALKVKQQQQQSRSQAPDDDTGSIPRSILRHLRVDDTIHLLVEYTGKGYKDSWLQFGSDAALNDWIQGVPGVPLALPQKCLTVEESSRITTESKNSMDRLVEEFRRYKVRSEIARKQKDSELRHSSHSSPVPPPSVVSVEQAMSDGTQEYLSTSFSSAAANTDTGSSGINAELQARINKDSNRWKLAYESVVKENEQLRHRGGESLVATQWRERYEICRAEKEELLARSRLAEGKQGSPCASAGLPGTSFQQMYMDLKAEYKEFHGRVLALEKERERKRELRRGGGSSSSSSGGGGGGGSEEKSRRREAAGSCGQQYGGVNKGGAAAKDEYVKNLILQYLCCKDPIVRAHMEIAIVQMFRFSEDEKSAIEDRKKCEENYEDALLSSITNFVSSAFYTTS